jgi:hypothetical protein
MKSVIVAGCCATGAFVGMFLYMGMPGSQPDPSPAAPVEPVAAQSKPAEEPRPKPKPAPAPTTSPKPRTAKRAAREATVERKPKRPVREVAQDRVQKPRTTRSRPAEAKASRPAGMYFTTDRDKHGIPSRVTVHNTPVGKCTILLIGIGRNSTYFSGKGTTSGKKKHRWEVQVSGGIVSVYWDGQSVRPG